MNTHSHPTARIIATGGEDGTIVLWNVETGERLSDLTGHSKHIHALAFSADSKTLASGGGNEIYLWNVHTGDLIGTLDAVENVNALALLTRWKNARQRKLGRANSGVGVSPKLRDTNHFHGTSRICLRVNVFPRWENTCQWKCRRHNPSLGYGHNSRSVDASSFIVKPTINWTSRMGEVTNLASGGVGLVPPEMSTYFRALLYSKAYNYLDALRGYNPRQRRWGRCSLTNCSHIFGLYYKTDRKSDILMKSLRFFLIPLLFICGVLLLSLLLRWIASPNSEETLTDFQTQAAAPAYTRWHLPEGATLRLGKGHIKDIKFVPDGTQFIVAASIGYLVIRRADWGRNRTTQRKTEKY